MQPSHSSLGTPDRVLNPPIQPRRAKLLVQLRQALCPRHYSRRDELLGATGGLPASGPNRWVPLAACPPVCRVPSGTRRGGKGVVLSQHAKTAPRNSTSRRRRGRMPPKARMVNKTG